MAYNDVSSVQFWGGLRRLPLGTEDARVQTLMASRRSVPHYHGAVARAFQRQSMPHTVPPNNDPLDQRLRHNWDTHQAPSEMVHEMHRQMVELHNLPSAPEPLEAAFMDWSDDPYGGGVHFWNPGY